MPLTKAQFKAKMLALLTHPQVADDVKEEIRQRVDANAAFFERKQNQVDRVESLINGPPQDLEAGQIDRIFRHFFQNLDIIPD